MHLCSAEMADLSSKEQMWPSTHYEGKRPRGPRTSRDTWGGSGNGDNYEGENEDADFGWIDLPDILLEDIFELMPPKTRHQCSQVCGRWYDTFYAPRVWHTFVLQGRVLTKQIRNLAEGYVRELCPRKTQVCFSRVGLYFKRILIPPMNDFYSLFEFMRVLSRFLTYFDEFPMPQLQVFQFTFACETRGMAGVIVHGTGGKILDQLEVLLRSMQNLKHLKLNQLLLEESAVTGFVAAIATNLIGTLRSLELVNCTKVPYPLPDLAQFDNLSKLTISPQHLDDEIIVLFATGGLCELHIVQDPYTCAADPVSADAWKLVKQLSPYLKVTLEIRGNTKDDIMIQPHAPVCSIIYSSPYSKLSGHVVMDLLYYYQGTLNGFIQRHIPRVHGPRSFSKRCDSALMMLVRNCPRLTTLVIRERLSTATMLLVAKEGKSLERLVVRQNALIKRSDWPKESHWSPEFYKWLRESSLSFDAARDEVKKLLDTKWRPLTDEEFKWL
jgi:F-box protein 39